jgi:hypothetical protein
MICLRSCFGVPIRRCKVYAAMEDKVSTPTMRHDPHSCAAASAAASSCSTCDGCFFCGGGCSDPGCCCCCWQWAVGKKFRSILPYRVWFPDRVSLARCPSAAAAPALRSFSSKRKQCKEPTPFSARGPAVTAATVAAACGEVNERAFAFNEHTRGAAKNGKFSSQVHLVKYVVESRATNHLPPTIVDCLI